MGAISYIRHDTSTNDVEAVYRLEHDRLWRALVAFCGDVDIASDAEAEAWAQALRGRDRIENIGAWIWTAAFRIAAGMQQTRGRPSSTAGPFTNLDDVPEDIRAQPVADSGLVELFDVLDDLTDQQRAAIVLRHVGRMRNTEIAETLGTSAAVIRVQLHRAHKQLRRALKETS